MNAETLQAATEHALREYPREACGLVAVVKGRERYFPCENKATTPSEHFVMRGEDWAAVEDKGVITTLFHSHPDTNPEPSDADRVMCEHSGVPWEIMSVIKDGPTLSTDQMRRIVPCGYKAPLVGRSFAYGVLDCYTLIQDWYAQERGITLPDIESTDGWWLEGLDLYMENFSKHGFYRLPDDAPLEVGDLIFMQIHAPKANHAGVYIGDTRMLHHLYGRLSSVDIYGGMWREVTRAVVRYKG